MRFQPLEKLINLHDNYTRQFKIDSYRLLLLQRNGEVFLMESHCPHREYPLELGTIDNRVIQCALHKYQFSMDDGRLLYASEERCRGLKIYPLVYQGNELGVMLE